MAKIKFNSVRLGGQGTGIGAVTDAWTESMTGQVTNTTGLNEGAQMAINSGDRSGVSEATKGVMDNLNPALAGRAYWVDATDGYANRGHYISFYSVPNAREVFFKAFITAYNETFNSDWGAESVYGRTDPIYMFKNTQRKITLAFKIPCANLSEGYENLARVQELTHYLYPTYTDPGNATTINQSPLVRLGVMNLVADNERGVGIDAGSSMNYGGNSAGNFNDVKRARSSGKAEFGLLGVVNNLTINHNLESSDGIMEVTDNFILPKLIEINLDFSPIHEKVLGWKNKKFQASYFPYGVQELHQGGDDTHMKTFADNAQNWDDAVEKKKALERKRDLAQAKIDNAKAHFLDATGELYKNALGKAKEDWKDAGTLSAKLAKDGDPSKLRQFFGAKTAAEADADRDRLQDLWETGRDIAPD
jgi:hypothetical protein